MADKKEMTAQTASVGADAGQSLTIKNTTIIAIDIANVPFTLLLRALSLTLSSKFISFL